MKNLTLFSLVFILGQLWCEEAPTNIPRLTDNARKALKHLYLLDKKSSLKIEEIDNSCLNYYLCTVYDHTRILEYKIEIKKDGWQSTSFAMGLFCAIVGASTSCLLLTNRTQGEKFFLGLYSALLFPSSLPFFYKAAYYQQRLAQRLIRNKRIFKLLQAEWLARNASTS
jgi:hypothetical protein